MKIYKIDTRKMKRFCTNCGMIPTNEAELAAPSGGKCPMCEHGWLSSIEKSEKDMGEDFGTEAMRNE